jgi:hypothetical protein
MVSQACRHSGGSFDRTVDSAEIVVREEQTQGGFVEHPRLQLLTVEELLSGKSVDMPPTRDVRTFKKAPKAEKKPVDKQKRFL